MILTVNVTLDADFSFQSVKFNMLTTEEQQRNKTKSSERFTCSEQPGTTVTIKAITVLQ